MDNALTLLTNDALTLMSFPADSEDKPLSHPDRFCFLTTSAS